MAKNPKVAPPSRSRARAQDAPPATTEGTRERSATAVQPFDVARPSPTSSVDRIGPDGRPQARQGLIPQDNERPHPTAAARPGKSSGMAGFAPAVENFDEDPDNPVDATTREVIIARRERSNPIQVEATALGYYDDNRRRPGEVFFIYHKSEFSSKWMRRTDGRRRLSAPATSQQALDKRHDEILGAKAVEAGGGRGPSAGILTGRDDVNEDDIEDTRGNPLGAR